METKNKILYILRGISGSGKSTLARELACGNLNNIISADDYFMVDGEYKFDPKKLAQAHRSVLVRLESAMRDGQSPLVCDNTHTQKWEAKNSVKLGLKYGYDVKFKETNTAWRFDAKELAKKNVHGVPESTIQKMINRYEDHDSFTIENVLNSKSPFDKD